MCSLVAQTPSGQPYSWRTVAVGGGGFVSGILFHPTEQDLVYARTDVGGAYRWDVPRREWIALNDDIGGLNNEFMHLGVLSFAVDPNDSDRLYLACGQYVEWWAPNAIALRSNDRGATWSRTDLPFKLGGNQDGRNTGERLAVDPGDGDILYLGTSQNGLWKSIDRGANWTQVTSFTPTSCTLVLFDKSTGTAGSATQTIYVGVNSTSSSSLYRSIDGGATWAPVSGQPAGLLPHHADIAYGTNNRSLFLAYSNAPGPNGASAGAVWKLDLDAGTWTNITPAEGAWGWGGVCVDASNPTTLIASTIDRWGPRDEIYRSTNSGDSWTPVLQTGTLDHSQAPWAADSIPHWTTDVKIDPFNSARAMFVTGFGLFETTSLGAATTAWTFHNEGLEETVPLGIVSPPSGAPLVSTLGDVDGFRHNDLTVEPSTRHAPMRGTNRSIDFAGAAPATMVRTFDGSTRGAYSSDGGTTWAVFAAAPSTSANGGQIAISADGATIVWSQDNTIAHRSTNSGASWTPSAGAPSTASNTYAPVADRVNADKFYINNHTTGRVYVSTDAGASFTAGAIVPTGAAPMRAVPGLEGNLWLPCWSSGLRRSTDSAASFGVVASVQEGYAVGFGKAAPGQSHPAVFIWGKVSGIVGLFRSDDAGTTWTRINDDLHQFGYINCMTGDPRRFGRIYLGTSGRGVVYGDVPPALPEVGWAPFTTGVAGSWIPPAHTSPYAPVFAATGLPEWASLDPGTGVISGTSSDPAGTIARVSIEARVDGQVLGAMQVNLITAGSGSNLAPVNMSIRGRVGTGDGILIPGFVVEGSSTRRFLIRAVGPALETDFGIAGALQDPLLSIIKEGVTVATNDNWSDSTNAAEIAGTGSIVGAFPLHDASKDAVLLVDLAPGVYSTQVSGAADSTGVALVEVYDASAGAAGSRLVNLSTRAIVGAGDEVLIPGIVFNGGGTKRLLLRAVGPTLGDFGVKGVLADPQLSIVKDGVVLATNDDWGTGTATVEIESVAASLGAFPLPAGSRDAVILATMPSGPYTIVLSGRGDTTGIALVEVYLVP